MKGVPGVPSKMKFDKLLENSLIWIDIYGVPQVGANRQDKDIAESAHDLETMLAAISSLPAYVRRASMFIVLTPVVPHAQQNVDCDFRTWQRRGWCRLESIVRSLTCSEKWFVTVLSERRVRLNHGEQIVQFPVGHGDFACCTLGHKVLAGGEERNIECDRHKVSPVLKQLFDDRLSTLSIRDLCDYRFLLAHGHVLLRNLPCLESLPVLDSWKSFAAAFQLDLEKPLKKCGGKYNWPPLAWAIMSNNHVVVKHLLSCKADVHQVNTVDKNVTCLVASMSVFHLNMVFGHGDDGTAIFDSLLAAKANPLTNCQGSRLEFGGRWGSPFWAGVGANRVDMCLHYIKRLPEKIYVPMAKFGFQGDVLAVLFGLPEVVDELDRIGATFTTPNQLGVTAIAAFICGPIENTPMSDIRVLDILYKSNKLGDINQPAFSGAAVSVAWYLRRMGLFKRNGFLRMLYQIVGGTNLHFAVCMDKPSVVVWLLEHKCDPRRTNKRG